MKIYKYLLLSLLVLILLISCQKATDIVTEEDAPASRDEEAITEEDTGKSAEEDTEEGTPEDIPSLKEVFKDDFYMGTAIEAYQLEIPELSELIKKHFSSITAENAMKPESIQPLEGNFDFRDADKIADFARENGIALRGHTLIWHNQVPDWFFLEDGGQVSKETLRERMKTHITEVMQRYKGQVCTRDVINNPINADTRTGYSETNGLKYKIKGKTLLPGNGRP